VAFDGVRIASGGEDWSVRIWDASLGHCIAILNKHAAPITQLRFSLSNIFGSTPVSDPILAAGDAEGRVVFFSLSTYTPLHHIVATDRDLPVTSLQFNDRWLVTGGEDGRIRLWEVNGGAYVKDISEGGNRVWKVVVGENSPTSSEAGEKVSELMALTYDRAGTTMIEIWSMRLTSA